MDRCSTRVDAERFGALLQTTPHGSGLETDLKKSSEAPKNGGLRNSNEQGGKRIESGMGYRNEIDILSPRSAGDTIIQSAA